MLDSGLPKSMWVLAVNATVHAYNRTLHKTIEFRVPLEKFAPSASCHFNQIMRFGCIGFGKIPKPDFKFVERAIKAVLVRYKTTGYLLWHPSTRKFIEFRHVRFNEKVVYEDDYKSDQVGQNSYESREENDCNWLKEFQDDKLEQTDKEKIEPKKRGRSKKQLDGNKKQKESPQQKDEGLITRNRAKRKIESEDKTKNVFIGKPINNITFINYAEYTDVSNTEEKQNKEVELRHCLLVSLIRDPGSFRG